MVSLLSAVHCDDLVKAKARLHGHWAVVNVERFGQTQTRDSFDGMIVTFKADTVTFKGKAEVTFTFALDLSQNPWHFDETSKDNKGN
jgi:uncharacterized protein (TIGR03067 family)